MAGKPAEIVENNDGRSHKKYLAENSLIEQAIR